MPIKGIESRFRYPTVGRFSLAHKLPSGGTQQVDYFIVPSEVAKIVGDQPKEVRIRFPGSNLPMLFDHNLVLWGLKTVKRRCDGERARVFPDEGPSTTEPCRWPDKDVGKCPSGCEAQGRLVFELLDSAGEPHGPYEVTINGMRAIADFMGLLTYYHGHLGERFTTAEFLLRRVPKAGTFTDKQGKKRTRMNHPVKLVLDRIPALLGLPAAVPMAPMAMLPAGHAEEPDESEHDDETLETEDVEFLPTEARAESTVPTGHQARSESPAPEGAAQAAPASTAAPPLASATWEQLCETATRAGIGNGTLGQYVKAKYPNVTEAGKPHVYGVLVEQMAQAIAAGPSALQTLKNEYFKAMREAAKGGR